MTEKPRAIGLMPTYNRPEMAHRAVHLFLEQDYDGDKHIIVYDDGEWQFEPCSSCRDNIDLVRHDRLKLPVKRNLMIERSADTAAVYITWDDDDYHGPTRIRRQVKAIASTAPEIGACILRPTLYYNSITRELATSNWLSDGTIAHTYDFWLKRPYNDQVDPGSGMKFVYPRMKEIVTIDAELDYCVVVHAAQRHSPPAFGPPEFGVAPIDADVMDRLLRMR